MCGESDTLAATCPLAAVWQIGERMAETDSEFVARMRAMLQPLVLGTPATIVLDADLARLCDLAEAELAARGPAEQVRREVHDLVVKYTAERERAVAAAAEAAKWQALWQQVADNLIAAEQRAETAELRLKEALAALEQLKKEHELSTRIAGRTVALQQKHGALVKAIQIALAHDAD